MNSFDRYSSKIKGVNIPLPSFHYNNKKDYDKQGKLIGRNLITERLKSWLLTENGGSYLVTGYRGMGKTSFVNRVLNEISANTSYGEALWGYILIAGGVLFFLLLNICIYLNCICSQLLLAAFCIISIRLCVAAFYKKYTKWRNEYKNKDSEKKANFLKRAEEEYNKNYNGEDKQANLEKITNGLSEQEWNWINYRINGEVLKDKEHSRIIVNVNLGQEILDVRSILCVLTSQLYTEYKKRVWSPFGSWYMWVSLGLVIVLGFHVFSNITFQNLPEKILAALIAIMAIAIMTPIIFPPINILMRLKILAIRINASMENGVNLSTSGTGGDIGSNPGIHSIFHYGLATTREIESQLISILDFIQRFPIHPKIIFVFDELDKIESSLRPADSSQEFTQDKYHPGGGTSRKRRSTVLHLLSNMKYFTSTAKAKFVFIAGREMYDSYLADLTDRESAISSIFNGVIYVDSFCKNEKQEKDGMYNVETFVCRQLLPEEYIRQQFVHEYIRCKLHDKKFTSIDINLKMYYKYLQTTYDECLKGKDRKEIDKAIKLLNHVQIIYKKFLQETANKEFEKVIGILKQLQKKYDKCKKKNIVENIINFLTHLLNKNDNSPISIQEAVNILKQLQNNYKDFATDIEKDVNIPTQLQNNYKDFATNIEKDVNILTQLLECPKNDNIKEAVNILTQLQNNCKDFATSINDSSTFFEIYYPEYGEYARTKKITDKEIERTIHLLNRFVFYLYQISNGSPKKIRLAFEKFVRPVSTPKDFALTTENLKPSVRQPDVINILTTYTDSKYQLSFGPKEQNVFEFIHHITFPINQILTDAERYGDKLLVSASFLTDHIYKYHTGAFSWNNLEQTPELLESFKIPELRTFINSILEYLTNTHLVKIQGGLFQYKFRMQITEEISMMSKVSEEIASIFNFTRDESQLIRQHYIERRDYFQETLNREGIHSHHAIAGHHHIMGDLYMAEEDYNYAIIEYNAAISALHERINKSQNDSLSLLRNYLKLGLAYEKRNTYNSAYCAYSDAIATKLNRYATKITLQQDEKSLVYQAILAKLFVQEKLENGGISKADVESAERDFNKISKDINDEYILDADFYMRLGDIMFYKNGTSSTSPNIQCNLCKDCNIHHDKHWKNYRGLPCSAASYYFESLQTIDTHLFNKKIGNYDPISIFKIIAEKGTAKTLRQNHITQMAEVLDCLGNTMLSCADKDDTLTDTFLDMYLGAMGYMNKNMDLPNNFQPVFSPANDQNEVTEEQCFKKLKNYNEKNAKNKELNRLEMALLYYWEAAITFRFVRDHKKASDCLKKILLVILNHLRVADQYYIYSKNDPNKKTKLSIGESLDKIKDRIVRQCLICLYAHYEFINIVEIQRLKWIFYTQMYEYSSLNRLSLFPDVEEIMLIYYEMVLLCTKDKMENDEGNEKLAAIYNSMSLGSTRHSCTTYENIMALHFKSELNEYILSLAFPSIYENFESKCKVEERHQKFANSLLGLKDSPNMQTENINLLKKFFETSKEFSTEKECFELLEFLIIDSIYCLTHILESVSPSPLFSHSFIGSTYRKLNRWNILFDTLFYCYKKADNPNTSIANYSNIFDVNDFIKNISAKSEVWKSLRKHFNCKSLSDRFFGEMLNAINKPNIHLLLYAYSGEKALTEFRYAREMHREGKIYKNMLSNLYFLDDDLNNDALQFNLAIERYVINNDLIDHYIKELLDTPTKSIYAIYDIKQYAEDKERTELTAEDRFLDMDWNVCEGAN